MPACLLCLWVLALLLAVLPVATNCERGHSLVDSGTRAYKCVCVWGVGVVSKKQFLSWICRRSVVLYGLWFGPGQVPGGARSMDKTRKKKKRIFRAYPMRFLPHVPMVDNCPKMAANRDTHRDVSDGLTEA